MANTTLDPEIIDKIAANAEKIDRGEISARYALELLGKNGGFEFPNLLTAARTIREIAQKDLTIAFAAWAQTMVATYLDGADNPVLQNYRAQIITGARPGITGMAPSFKAAAGNGEIPLKATETEGGYTITGRLNWASNLANDAIIVSTAETASGERFLFATELAAKGIEPGTPANLLALNSAANASITFTDVFIRAENIISRDFAGFLSRVRQALFILGTSECLGVAETAINTAHERLWGLSEVLREDVEAQAAHIASLIETQERLAQQENPSQIELIKLRLAASRAANTASALEMRVSGGRGYEHFSDTSRRLREATFLAVQSPNEVQLQWQLQQLGETL